MDMMTQTLWILVLLLLHHFEDGDTTGTSCADVDSVWISNVMQRDANTSSDNLTRLMFSWNPDPEIAAQNRSEYNYTLVVGKKDAGIFEDVHRVQTPGSATHVLVSDFLPRLQYIALVCNTKRLGDMSLANATNQYIPECGYCYTVFTLNGSTSATNEVTVTMETVTPTEMPAVQNFTPQRTTSVVSTTSTTTSSEDTDHDDDLNSRGFPEYATTLIVMVPLTLISMIMLVVASLLLHIWIKKRRQCNGNERCQREKSSRFSFSRTDVSMQLSQGADIPMERMLKERLPKEMFIFPSNLSVSVEIGQGEFGIIYKAFLKTKGSSTPTAVAIKTLKGIFTTASDIETATKEIRRMSQFDHRHVISLLGVCMNPPQSDSTSQKSFGPSIVMPFMERGNLLEFLRRESKNLHANSEDEALKVRKSLVQICYQIAKGMEYLASLNYVHRDLAARNCLIDENFVIKVSDFGLTENTYARNYFRQQAGNTKLPLKWMAIESIKFGVFSEKTDVWSYGVTCWEVFSGGVVPYPGTHPKELLAFLETGGRLIKPTNAACFNKMQNLMQSCWRAEKDSRPTFSGIVHMLETYLAKDADYTELSELMESNTEHKPRLSMSLSHGFINKIAIRDKSYYIASN